MKQNKDTVSPSDGKKKGFIEKANTIAKTVQKGAETVGKVAKAAALLTKLMGANHPIWYKQNNLIDSVRMDYGIAQPSGYIVAGAAVGRSESATELDLQYTSVPNVAAFSVGLTTPHGSATQLQYTAAITRLVNALNAVATGSQAVTALEVSVYIWNVRLVDTAFAMMAKSYEAAMTFKSEMPTLRDDLSLALGVDLNSSELADVRTALLQMRSNIIENYPGTYYLRDRTAQLFRGWYKDNPGAKHTIIVTRPSISTTTYILGSAGGWSNATTKNCQLTASNFNSIVSNALPIATMRDNIENMLSDLAADSAMIKVASLWHSAFGIDVAGDLYVVPEEDSKMEAVYNEEILMQLQNARMAPVWRTDNGLPSGTTATVITALASGDAPIQTTVAAVNSTDAEAFNNNAVLLNDYYNDLVINVNTASEPSQDDTIVSSQFLCKWNVTETTAGKVQVNLAVSGFFFMNDYIAVNHTLDATNNLVLTPNVEFVSGPVVIYGSNSTTASTSAALTDYGQVLGTWSNIDWAPPLKAILIYQPTDEGLTPVLIATPIMEDYAQFALVSVRNIDSLHGYSSWSLINKGVYYKDKKLTKANL